MIHHHTQTLYVVFSFVSLCVFVCLCSLLLPRAYYSIFWPPEVILHTSVTGSFLFNVIKIFLNLFSSYLLLSHDVMLCAH